MTEGSKNRLGFLGDDRVARITREILKRPKLASGACFALAAFLVVLPFEILGVLIGAGAAFNAIFYPGYYRAVIFELIFPFLQLTVLPAVLGFVFGYFIGGRLLEQPAPSRSEALGRGALIAAASMIIWIATGLIIVTSLAALSTMG